MERYNEYKDSGVQWLGEIPSHWEVVRNKFIFRESEERNSERRYQLLSFSKNRGIVPYAEINDKESSTEDLSKYKILHIGQLLENRLQAWNGMFSHSEIEGCVSPDYSVFSLIKDGVNIKYVSYLFRTPLYIEQWANASKGIGSGFNRLYTPQFNAIQCLIPPFEEQNRMVAYLDTVTSKIDTAIAQQQKMIDLLNERKQIIINNAVTKGLNPNVKMKDSGVDWIGEIPKHWICCSFRNIIDVLTDYTANGSFGDLAKNVNYQSEGYARLIRLTDLRENLENENGVWVDKHGYEYLSKSTLYGGELLMANVGAYSGLPCIMPKVDYLTTLAPNMFLIKQDVSKADTSYLFYLLSSYDYFNWLQTIALASAQPKLNKENIRSLQILLPPRVEQEQIVRHIQDKIKPLELSISVAKQQISLLQERKQIIINEVVTGKVKVCNN